MSNDLRFGCLLMLLFARLHTRELCQNSWRDRHQFLILAAKFMSAKALITGKAPKGGFPHRCRIDALKGHNISFPQALHLTQFHISRLRQDRLSDYGAGGEQSQKRRRKRRLCGGSPFRRRMKRAKALPLWTTQVCFIQSKYPAIWPRMALPLGPPPSTTRAHILGDAAGDRCLLPGGCWAAYSGSLLLHDFTDNFDVARTESVNHESSRIEKSLASLLVARGDEH
ncbi:hypothetical protein [Belnapia rosea]|uniref:hypothetical protein n=1 Tax=Belnapia rosea TaxID=938405 RepID=UPI001FE1CDDA|nr:hypothetical protein [Belnapia rosea]